MTSVRHLMECWLIIRKKAGCHPRSVYTPGISIVSLDILVKFIQEDIRPMAGSCGCRLASHAGGGRQPDRRLGKKPGHIGLRVPLRHWQRFSLPTSSPVYPRAYVKDTAIKFDGQSKGRTGAHPDV